MKKQQFIFLGIIFLFPVILNAQQKDTTEKDYWHNLVSSNSYYSDSSLVKAHADDLLGNLGISRNREKIVLVRDYNDHYELWQINLNSKHAVMLAKTNDKNFEINQPSWSPDGKWIAFNTFSLGGHSPATTDQTWIVDSSGNGLQHIVLPNPYNKFSNYIIKWEGRHILIIKGVAMKFIDGKWNDLEKKFSYDCESKIVRTIK
jgi:hypothetical protein